MNIARILQHNVIGKLLNHAVVFVINICIVRLIGAEGSGTYFNELYVLHFIVFIFSGGLDYSAIAWLSRDPGLLPKIHRLFLTVTIFFAVILLVWIYVFLPGKSDYFRQLPIAIVIFSTGNLVLIFYQGILSAMKRFNLQNLLLLSTNLLFLGYILFLMKSGKTVQLNDIAVPYACLFLLQGFLMGACSWKNNQGLVVAFQQVAFFRSGLFIMFSSLLYFAFLRVDNFFVEKYCSPVTLGNYVQCGKIGQYFLYFSSIISSTLLPFLSSESEMTRYDEWRKLMKPYVVLLSLAGLFIVATGRQLFPFIFGPDFTEMYPIMLILLPGFICLGMLTLINAVYISKGNIKRIFIGDLGGLCFVLLADILLVEEYGVYAAAIISSVAYCLLFFYLLAGLKKQF